MVRPAKNSAIVPMFAPDPRVQKRLDRRKNERAENRQHEARNLENDESRGQADVGGRAPRLREELGQHLQLRVDPFQIRAVAHRRVPRRDRADENENEKRADF
ncbi:MAG: hypothetical protein M5R36_26850 [Deltaproteobacteria bacterium]|nr:hypothetical protein [Deltaproteobacteria bacterium]